MKPITTSIYSFEKLIGEGFLYVDKTNSIHAMIARSAQCFLSRPRRFGKSLLVSTLKAIFEGNRYLFKGLAIDSLSYDWKIYPIIHLDMAGKEFTGAESLRIFLANRVDQAAAVYDITLTNPSYEERFEELITTLENRLGKVVILIDEYDKPILAATTKNVELAMEMLPVLKVFYGVIKKTEKSQRFCLITGVSKFSKVSLFSDLNNLTDLTMQRDTATLLGYTQEELEENFIEYINRLVRREEGDREEILARLRIWYNGYRFEEHAPTVYNPVSVMKCLDEEKFRNYWFETGTPSFLIELLREKAVNLGNLDVPEIAFSTYEVENLEPLPLLVQAGYLTITGFNQRGLRRIYHLGYPNYEIEESFNLWLAEGLCGVKREDTPNILLELVRCFDEMDMDNLFVRLQAFFAGVPNTITLRNEKYYQTIFFVIFKLLGVDLDVEVNTNLGRIDAVVQTNDRVYIFEFKLYGTAENALQQIHDKRYHEKYLHCGKQIVFIGAAFSPETRNLDHWIVETTSIGGVGG